MIYRFGSFEIDIETFELRKRGEALAIQRKVFDVLRYLVEHRDRVVWKDELLEAVWAKEFVVDTAVHRVISQLRRALGQSGRSTPIETIHGRGYRFRAPIEVLASGASEASGSLGIVHHEIGDCEADPFVGRAEVIGTVLRAIREAPESGGRIFLLTGEPGIGKTRCAEFLCRAAQAQGARLWRARCSKLEGAPALWPWLQILRDSLSDLTESHPLREVGERLLSHWAGDRDTTDLLIAAPAKGNAAAVKFQFLDEIHRFLIDVVGSGVGRPPCVLWLDDISPQDTDSFRILDLLCSGLSQVPLVILATVRNDPSVQLRDVLDDMHEELQQIPIEGLRLDEVTEYVSLVTQLPDSSELTREIHRKTGGNPLFMRELLRFLMTTHGRDRLSSLPLESIELPAAVCDVVERRLQELDVETRHTLGTAAVLGESFDVSLLEKVIEVESPKLRSILDAAVAAGLLRANSDALEYRFTHGLIRDVLYRSLAPTDVAPLHLRTAQALESHAADSAALSELAYHFYRSLPLGPPRKAIRYGVDAARAVSSSGGYTEAVRFLTWALAAQRMELTVNPRARCTLLLSAALCEGGAGNTAGLRGFVKELLDVATRNGFIDVVALSGLVLRPMSAIAAAEPDPLARQALETARDALPEHLGSLKARVLSMLSCMPPYAHDREKRLEMSTRARELAQPNDPRSQFDALTARHFALSAPEDLEEARTLAPEFARACREAPTSISAIQAHFYAFQTFLRSGDVDAASRELRALGHLAHEWQLPEQIWIHDRLDLQESFYEGNLRRVAKGLQRLHQRSRKLRLPLGDRYAQVFRSHLRRELGDDLETRIDLPLQFLNSDWELLIWQARVVREAAETGRHDEARTALNRLARSGFRDIPRDGVMLATLAELSLAVVILEETEHAEALLELMAPYGSHIALDEFFFSWGSVAYFLGILSLLVGDRAGAVQHLEQATSINKRIKHRPQLMRAGLALGQALSTERSPGVRARGLDVLQRVLVGTQKMELTTSRQATEVALHSAGLPLPPLQR